MQHGTACKREVAVRMQRAASGEDVGRGKGQI